MPKAVMVNATQSSYDPTTPSSITINVEFHIVGTSPDFGVLYTSVSISDTDTAATSTTKVQNAIISKAAEYGITLAASDLISVVLGVPQSLMSSTSSATMTLEDDGVNMNLYGSLGTLRILGDPVYGPTLKITPGANVSVESAFTGNSFTFSESDVFGSGDISFLFRLIAGTGYGILQSDGLGIVLATSNAAPISVRPNLTQVAYFDGSALNMAAGITLNNIARPSIAGSRVAGIALTNLLIGLASAGLITDSTTV